MSKIKNLGSIELILGMWVSVEIDGGERSRKGILGSEREVRGIVTELGGLLVIKIRWRFFED